LVLFVLIYSIKKGGIKQVSSSKKLLIQIIRGILLISCVCIGVYSFTVLGLVVAHTIIAIYPLLVLPLSYYFLNEKIGWRRWSAVFIGFFGIMIILNPISMSFDFNMLWPLLLACLLAIYSILTRNISAYDNSETSFFWVAIVGGVIMTIIGPFFFELLVLKDIPWFLFLCILSTCGHFLFIKALETAQASILQPFIYLQLFFASIIGILIFNDLLTLNLIFGGILIIGSGIFVLIRTHNVQN
jgi:drug/metabolite transporter (DMT)-like permease